MIHLSLTFNLNTNHSFKDIAATKNTRILTELLMEVKEMSRDIQWIKAEIAKSSLNAPGAGPDPPQREETFPFVLPLSSEEQFDEAETALREENVRRKMVSNVLSEILCI